VIYTHTVLWLLTMRTLNIRVSAMVLVIAD
jgi:hypothetical protein